MKRHIHLVDISKILWRLLQCEPSQSFSNSYRQPLGRQTFLGTFVEISIIAMKVLCGL